MRHNVRTFMIWILAMAMIFSLTACGSNAVPTGAETSGTAQTIPEKTSEPAKETTKAATTEAEQTTGQTTEAATEATEEESTEPATEEDTEPSEPESQLSPEEFKERQMEAFIKYQHLLAVHLESIEDSPFTIIDPNGEEDRPMQVVLADIHGDEIPEIIFVEHDTDEQGTDVEKMQIYTFYGETIDLLYEETVDIAAGAGMRFCLFQNGEDKEPWLLIQGGEGETVTQSVDRIRYERKADGTYVWTGTKFYCVEAGADAEPGSVTERWNFCDEQGCESLEKDEYYARLAPILNDTHPLIHNYTEYYLPEDLAGKTMQAMTYDEAMELMESFLNDEEPTEPGAGASELFMTIQGEYYQHGGDWATWLTVYGDGSFTGEYQAHYNPGSKTHYDVGNFHGQFSEQKQIDDLTWTIRVEELYVDGEIGEKWENEDGEYERIGDPMSPIKGTELTVYLPGTDSTQIPEEFFMWIRSSAEQMPELEGTALVNDEVGINTYYYKMPED